MGFEDLPVGAKYALIGGIAVLLTLLLILGRFLWGRRRKQQRIWKARDIKRAIEEAIIEPKPEATNSLPTRPRAAQLPISGPVRPQDEDHKEEYSRTASLMPTTAVVARPATSRPHPSELNLKPRVHPSLERKGSVHSDFSNVPTEFNLAMKSPRRLPQQQGRHRRHHSEDIDDTYLPLPTTTPQPRSITPPSPSIYSPGIERAASRRQLADITSPTSPITSPTDDSYIRAPRLYEPPSMAHGEADLPYSPPRRNKPHGSYQPGGSLRRKRSISLQDASTLLRVNSNASGGSLRRKNSRRGAAGDRISTQSEWIDTLTVIDDEEAGEPGTPRQIISPGTQSQLLVPRKSTVGSVRKTRSVKRIPNPIQTSAPSTNTSWNNTVIAEQMAAIKYSTKRNRSKSPPKSGKNDGEP